MLMYCKKCGRIVMDAKKCDVCKSFTYEVPEQYWLNGHDFLLNPKLKDQFIEECIKSSPEFDQELFDNRDAIRAQKSAKYEQAMNIGNAIRKGANPKIAFRNGGQNMPKCPTCGSTNVEKIPVGKKVVGGAMFGLFSSNVRNTMCCRNCGYKW